MRNHALESGAFVVNATAWLDADQQAQIMADTGCPIGPISGGFFTAIVSPQGEYLGEPLRSGEGEVIADLDFSLINIRKILMDASGHYSRPELLSLMVDRTPSAHLHDRFEHVRRRTRGGRRMSASEPRKPASTGCECATTARKVTTN